MARVINTGAYFDKRYKKLPWKIKERAKRKEIIFRDDPFDPRLRAHKLHGGEKET